MIEYAARKKIRTSIYTNGQLLDDEKRDLIFRSGLNEINFSMEGTGDYYTHFRGKEYPGLVETIKKVLDERQLRKSPLSVGINAARTSDDAQVSGIFNEWYGVVDYIMVEPLMGGKANPRSASCRTLWRNLVIAWNGAVVPCCVDMHDSMVLGDATRNTLVEIMNGARAKEIRASHLDGRFPLLCKYCDSHFG
jgi:radical SAM protein with 4Fe4S-binding SPASM domain